MAERKIKRDKTLEDLKRDYEEAQSEYERRKKIREENNTTGTIRNEILKTTSTISSTQDANAIVLLDSAGKLPPIDGGNIKTGNLFAEFSSDAQHFVI